MNPSGWKTRSLGSLLDRVVDPVDPAPNAIYREIGIRSHGKGIFHKEPIVGKELGDKRVFKVVPGCLVLNIVFAWEQAVAKTTEAEQGMIASHRFPMYRPKNDACDVDYLVYLFKTTKGKYLLELASPGGAGRNKTLGQKEFSNIKITLPVVEEQRKIAKILSTWDRAIATTEKLIANSQAQKKALMQQLLTGKKRFPGFSKEWRRGKLGEIAQINPSVPEVQENSLVSFVPMEAVSEDAQLIRHYERSYQSVDIGFSAFKNDDILVAKITPCFENGKGAYVEGLVNGIGVGSTEFVVLRSKSNISAKFLYHLTNTFEFRVRGEMNMQGSAGQKRVPTSFIRSYKFYIPSDANEQHRIVDALEKIRTAINTITRDRDALILQKKSLMQQLLTGQRRVKLDAVA